MRRKILFSLVLFVVAGQCHAGQAMKVYADKISDYTINYPSGWTIEPDHMSYILSEITAGDKRTNLDVTVIGTHSKMPDVIKAHIESFINKSKAQVMAKEQRKVGPRQVTVVSYRGKQQGESYFLKHYFYPLADEGTLFVLEAKTPYADRQAMAPVLDKIAYSLKIGKDQCRTWKKFEPRDKSFSIKMPGEPRVLTTGKGDDSIVYVAQVKDGMYAYMVSYLDANQTVEPRFVQKVIGIVENSIKEINSNFKLITSRPNSLHGHSGKIYYFESNDGKESLSVEIYIIGSRAYVLQCKSPRQKFSIRHNNSFFASFRERERDYSTRKTRASLN